MKKRISALLLCAAMLLTALPAGAAFTDISDPEMAVAAGTLQGMAITSGTSATTFSPDGTLTRAQACTMLVQAMGLSSQVNTYSRKTIFSDVASSAWYNGSVNLAYSKGVINGYGNGTFGPEDPVTYGQFATMLLRMLGYTSQEIGKVWPLDYTAYCDDLGLSKGLSLQPNQSLTRGETAVLLYRALKETVNGSDKEYYRTISDVSSVQDVILLDVSASQGEETGLVMVFDLEGKDGVTYYTAAKTLSDSLTGCAGALLFDSSGRVNGFVPESESTKDVVIDSATASTLKAKNGTSYRLASGAMVIADGEVYPYSTSGYIQLNAAAGKTARLYYEEDGALTYIYLAGGTAAASQAAVASAASPEDSLVQALGLSGRSFTITKNGVTAEGEDLAQYDVGYYDAGSNTLRVSDYRVSGLISGASPNLAAAETVTVAGHTFQVLECAWDSLEDFTIGKQVTLLLTDDHKVAAAYSGTKLSAGMVGVLSKDGRTVTLAGSGITLTDGDMDYEEKALGSLVTVTSTADGLRCRAVSASGSRLDLENRTLGSLELAPACAVYEWSGSGYVYDLEGNLGASSTDFDAVNWTNSLSESYVSYYRTNSAGEVDVVLLKNVTGNAYSYGKIKRYTGDEGVSAGNSGATNSTAALTNSDGTTARYICQISVASNRCVGIALGQSSTGSTRVAAIQLLEDVSGVEAGDFFLQDGDWYAAAGGQQFPVSEQLQVYFSSADIWMEGEEGLVSALADGYKLTLYYDRDAAEGGQIRILEAVG